MAIIIVAVRVQTRAKVEQIKSDGERITIKINQAPVDGKANEVVLQRLAKAFRIPKSQIVIKSGHTHRDKLLAIETDLSKAALLALIDGI